MGWMRKGAVALGLTMILGSQALAQNAPPLLANFPDTADASVQQAFAEHIRSRFPRDIRPSTLIALLEMDGFTTSTNGDRYTASFQKTEFPCLTNYELTWGENDRGRVAGLEVSMQQKCV